MQKKYFPGANSGEGFFSRFSGVVPPWEKSHYTYVLKGGPGVGKNTLMKKAAKRALDKGYEVEEFRCASDPKSLDAIRITDIGVVILDGTSPHSIDPVLPGIGDEIVDLGHFKNKKAFAESRDALVKLFCENKRYYNAAYAMLSAACTLKREALSAMRDAVNLHKLNSLLERLINAKAGKKRELFACSATPDGVIDFSPSFLSDNTVKFSGIVGEIALIEAARILDNKQCSMFYGFADPRVPHCLSFGETALALDDDGDSLNVMCSGNTPAHVGFCLDKAEHLIKRATSELSKALAVHDEIEKIYREYVDYDRVNEEGENLLRQIGV